MMMMTITGMAEVDYGGYGPYGGAAPTVDTAPMVATAPMVGYGPYGYPGRLWTTEHHCCEPVERCESAATTKIA